MNTCLILFSIIVVITLVFTPYFVYAEEETGQLEIILRSSSGDRAGPYGITVVIYDEPENTIHSILEPNLTYPYFLANLTKNQTYRIETFVNDMLVDHKYVKLFKDYQQTELFHPNPSGLKFTAYYNDGITPITSADFNLITYKGNVVVSDVTDNRGETQRNWITPTIRPDEFYRGVVSIGDSLEYKSQKVKLVPGQQRNIKIITPWNEMTDLLTINVVNNNSTNIKIQLLDSQNSVIQESDLDWKQRAFFNTIKTGNYDLQVLQNNNILFKKSIIVTGTNLEITFSGNDFDFTNNSKSIIHTVTNQTKSNCDCLDRLQNEKIPKWLGKTIGLWLDGVLTDSYIISGFQSVINNSTEINGDNTVSTVPYWLKTTMNWWYQGNITDTELVHNIRYLSMNNILKI